MDIKRVENFFELLNDTDIKELCWEKEGLKLRIKRGNFQIIPEEEEVVINDTADTAGSVDNTEEVAEVFDQEVINSGFVGSFCISNGKKKIELKEGDRVQNGQIVGFVEAMNIFKEVTTEFAGVIKELKIKDGDHVEYGQELFVIDIK